MRGGGMNSWSRAEMLRATALPYGKRRTRRASQDRVSTMLTQTRRRLDTLLNRLEAEGHADLSIYLRHEDFDDLCGEMIFEFEAGLRVAMTQDHYRDHPYYTITEGDSFVAYVDRVTRKRRQEHLCCQPLGIQTLVPFTVAAVGNP